MTKFSLSSAWDDAVQLMRWEPALTLPIVGMLVLLPALVFALLGPVPTEPPTGADFATVAETLRADISRTAPLLLLVALLSSFAAVTVMRLWLSPGGTSVGEALAFAASLIPVIVLLFIIQAISMGFAALLFILPALYLTGRWAPMLALLAAGETRGPIDALAKSWAMTRGNGWRIALMLFLVQLVVAIVTLILDSTGSLFGARGTIGHAVASVINAAMAALGALVAYALSAAVYRQLSSSNVARTFD